MTFCANLVQRSPPIAIDVHRQQDMEVQEEFLRWPNTAKPYLLTT